MRLSKQDSIILRQANRFRIMSWLILSSIESNPVVTPSWRQGYNKQRNGEPKNPCGQYLFIIENRYYHAHDPCTVNLMLSVTYFQGIIPTKRLTTCNKQMIQVHKTLKLMLLKLNYKCFCSAYLRGPKEIRAHLHIKLKAIGHVRFFIRFC